MEAKNKTGCNKRKSIFCEVNTDYMFADVWPKHAPFWLLIDLQYKMKVNKDIGTFCSLQILVIFI